MAKLRCRKDADRQRGRRRDTGRVLKCNAEEDEDIMLLFPTKTTETPKIMILFSYIILWFALFTQFFYDLELKIMMVSSKMQYE